MCMVSQPKAPTLPNEPALLKLPDGNAIKTAASRRITDQVMGSVKSILTSGNGVLNFAPTEKKTLLGA